MASINLGRVVAGGLVAGVVANAIDFVTNTYVLAPDIAAWAPTRNLDPAAMNSGPVAATWIDDESRCQAPRVFLQHFDAEEFGGVERRRQSTHANRR